MLHVVQNILTDIRVFAVSRDVFRNVTAGGMAELYRRFGET